MSAAELQTYGVNLLLHTALLSFVALAVAACFKNPHARSLSAAVGLLSLAVIPWMSALHVPTRNTVVAIHIAPVAISTPISASVVTSMDTGTISVRETAPSPAAPPAFELPDPWTLPAGIWALGCAVQITRKTLSAIRLARWESSLRHCTELELQTISAHSPKLTKSYQVRISTAGTSPCVTGCFRPTLVLPENLLTADHRSELNWALRHEAGHINGHDLQWLALFQLILAVFWWNPIAHRLVRLWGDARELACDQLAISDPRDRAEYGAFIVALGTRPTNGAMLAMADRGTFTRLKHRIRFLMEAKKCRPCGRGFIAGGTLAAVLTGLCVAQVGVKAETPTPAPEPPHSAAEGMTETKPDGAAPADKNPPPNIQIKFSTKFLVTSTPLAPMPGDPRRDTRSDEQLKTLLRELSKKRDTTLMTAPAVTARPRQTAMIEIIREGPDNHPTPFPTNSDPDTRQTRAIDDPDYQFAGIRMEFTPEFQGEQIQMKCRLAYGHIPGSDPDLLDKADVASIPWKKIRVFRAESSALLKPTESVLVPVGEIDPGRCLTLVVSVIPIDTTGRAIDTTGEFIAADETGEPPLLRPHTPLPPLPPFTARVSGLLATIDAGHKGTQLTPSNMPAPCFFGTATDELIAEIRNAAKGPVVSLADVELGESIVPLQLWGKLPEFGASFTRSDLPHLASFFWGYDADPTQPTKITGSIGIVGSHGWCFELPPETAGTRRFLILNFEMIRK